MAEERTEADDVTDQQTDEQYDKGYWHDDDKLKKTIVVGMKL